MCNPSSASFIFLRPIAFFLYQSFVCRSLSFSPALAIAQQLVLNYGTNDCFNRCRASCIGTCSSVSKPFTLVHKSCFRFNYRFSITFVTAPHYSHICTVRSYHALRQYWPEDGTHWQRDSRSFWFPFRHALSVRPVGWRVCSVWRNGEIFLLFLLLNYHLVATSVSHSHALKCWRVDYSIMSSISPRPVSIERARLWSNHCQH